MVYHLVASGYRSSLARLTFDPKGTLEVVNESDIAENVSWVTAGARRRRGPAHPVGFDAVPKQPPPPGEDGNDEDFAAPVPRTLYTVSEVEDGSVISVERKAEGYAATSEQKTGGVPCHGVVVSNYVGGSVGLHIVEGDGKLASAEPLALPRVYPAGSAPNPERQDAPHAHGVIEHDGKLYAADLGSDRVWILRRTPSAPSGLEITGHLQCDAGFGPRHCVVTPDNKTLLVLGEMGHTLAAFDLETADPVAGVAPSYLPPNVPLEYTKYMDGAEVAVHPKGHVAYASNRLELHVNKLNPSLPPLPAPEHTGDAVAVIPLGDNWRSPGSTSWVRTGCCCIRGMALSPDNMYAAVAGQCNSRVEIYAVSPDRREWTLKASLKLDKVTDFVWL